MVLNIILTYLHFGSAFGEAVFTGLTGTEKGELSMQMGCSLLPPGSGEDMMLMDTFLSQKRTHTRMKLNQVTLIQ